MFSPLLVGLVMPLLLAQLTEQAGIAVSSIKVTTKTGPALTFQRTHHTIQKRHLFSEVDIQAILDTHNNHRRQEGASDMQRLSWNNELADMANAWASACIFEHGQPPVGNPPYDPIGQNLYAVSGADLDVAEAITAWYDEKPYYNYDTMECQADQMCGHYTQVVWASTQQVGCAAAFCPMLEPAVMENANYFVCNYGPAGNWWGEHPFQKGAACSMCADATSSCDNGLCTEPMPLKK